MFQERLPIPSRTAVGVSKDLDITAEEAGTAFEPVALPCKAEHFKPTVGQHRRGVSCQTSLRCVQKGCARRRGRNFLVRSSMGSSMWHSALRLVIPSPAALKGDGTSEYRYGDSRSVSPDTIRGGDSAGAEDGTGREGHADVRGYHV